MGSADRGSVFGSVLVVPLALNFSPAEPPTRAPFLVQPGLQKFLHHHKQIAAQRRKKHKKKKMWNPRQKVFQLFADSNGTLAQSPQEQSRPLTQ
jgi:hypothetical protein